MPLEVQGHRGALGLAPENTLAGFEIALDVGVTSIETDVHLTRDDVPVLFHDSNLSTAAKPLVRSLTLEQLRAHRVQGPRPTTPAADQYAQASGIDACGIPTPAELFAFVAAYAGELGQRTGKTDVQRKTAAQLIFDIELKRVPFRPETIGDGFDGKTPGLLERLVVDAIRQAGVLHRSRVRSFDHRSVRAAKQLAPDLEVGILTHYTAPVDIASMLEAVGADFYAPGFLFVDEAIVRQVRAAGKRVIPYTVNEPVDWEKLVTWGVDGITTDVPDRLKTWLATEKGA